MLLSVPWVFQLAPCFPVSPTVENASALSFFFQGKTVLHCLVRPQFVFFFSQFVYLLGGHWGVFIFWGAMNTCTGFHLNTCLQCLGMYA